MILNAGASLVDVAFAACTVLAQAGETAVLCGGSAAAYYVPDLYQSLDVDFVVEVGAAPHIVDRALGALGYAWVAEGHYRHPTLPYTLAFPIGPLAIGREYVTAWRTDRRGDLLLHVYTPTDVVRDRFLHYWAWGDRAALDVALAVARARAADVDLDAFRAWTERELAADGSYQVARVARFFDLLGRAG
ncbi:MAG TPA: hypothetical protein VHS78_00215 [Candidatus Elarobacter sp.]|nr:hypothetical protein [Candidatus Elarobacter sp.]